MMQWLIRFFKKQDELIGIWTNEDDGSGLIAIFGWSLHFHKDGTGISYYWHQEEETQIAFSWERRGANCIALCTANEDWEVLFYTTVHYIGAYNSKQIKLTEVGKERFWNSHEPLFKRRRY